MNRTARKISIMALSALVALALLTSFSGKASPGMSLLDFEPAAASAQSQSGKGSEAAPQAPTGSGFTYQGRLLDGTGPANGNYDLKVSLFDASTGGAQVGAAVVVPTLTVTDGLFTVNLDFGATAFNGEARYVEVEVKPAGGPTFIRLSPRKQITPAPYALFALKTQGYKNIKVVAKAGGDFTTLTDALNSITDNSASNRYLIKVAPGTYIERVTMKPYVDIEGSGELNTVITWIGSPTGYDHGTIVGASNVELRQITITNTGGNSFAMAIYADGNAPRLTNVTLNASGGSYSNIGLYYSLVGSTTTLSNVTINASGGMSAEAIQAHYSTSGTLIIKNSYLSATGASAQNTGITTTYSNFLIDASQIHATNHTIRSTDGVVRFWRDPTLRRPRARWEWRPYSLRRCVR